MATLAEVRNALKTGDRKQAAVKLKSVLQENPTADAWFMAAKMSSDTDTAIKHLKRALMMNSKHTQSRDLLRELGGASGGGAAVGILGEIRTEMENFGDDSRIFGPLMSRFSPQQRVIVVGVMFFVVITLVLLMSINLITPDPVRVQPTPVPVAKIQSEQVVPHFSASGLTIAAAQPINALVKEQYSIQVQDVSGVQNVTLYVYDSMANLVSDRQRLSDESKGSNAAVYQTAALIYPAALSADIAAQLESIFNSLPVS